MTLMKMTEMIRKTMTMTYKNHIIESDVETYFRKEVKKLGGLCYKFTSPQNSGVPDRIVIYNGLVVFVELKKPGEKPRKLQQVEAKKMRAHGAMVFVVDSHKAVDMFITELSEATNE